MNDDIRHRLEDQFVVLPNQIPWVSTDRYRCNEMKNTVPNGTYNQFVLCWPFVQDKWKHINRYNQLKYSKLFNSSMIQNQREIIRNFAYGFLWKFQIFALLVLLEN